MRRPFFVAGRISIARTQRGSVTPVSTIGLYHASCACAGMCHAGDLMTRSGWPKVPANSHESPLGHFIGGGISFRLPAGAPASTHSRIVSICASDSDASFSKCWMPTVLSRCHGGIWCAATRVLIERAHGLASS